MTKQDDIRLPEGYKDWVEVSLPEVRYSHLAPLGQAYLRVSHGLFELHMDGSYREVHSGARYFVPPKPKPTLPDVKPGAVLRYTSKHGLKVRAVYRSVCVWDTYRQKSAPLNTACTADVITESQLLADVNANGFTVELDGL